MIVFKTYSAWDKQYILDTMLRDAVILLRPVEVKKLIEIGANINCNQFPQVKRLRILPRLYSTGIWSIRGRHRMSQSINLIVIKLDKANWQLVIVIFLVRVKQCEKIYILLCFGNKIRRNYWDSQVCRVQYGLKRVFQSGIPTNMQTKAIVFNSTCK